MNNISTEDQKAVKSTIREFKKEFKNIEEGSLDLFALIIFINSAVDTQSFPSMKFSALVHYPKARAAGWPLDCLLSSNGMAAFNHAVLQVRSILIDSQKFPEDLCSTT
ncbi:hypothetical protein ACRN9C_03605 [Shewanella frigidimarina]|uniref:hypothetical protein n=1 Tax=Shewanella frigidimarina TaxID=56812 RepID=UPI003D7B5659